MDVDLAELLTRLGLGETDRCDLGVAVGDARDADILHGLGAQPGDLLGHEDAVGEAAVRQLQARDQVTDGVHVRTLRCAAARR